MTIDNRDSLKAVHRYLQSIYQVSDNNGAGSPLLTELLLWLSFCKGLKQFLLLSKHPVPREWLSLLR